jgi:hypothetical protein
MFFYVVQFTKRFNDLIIHILFQTHHGHSHWLEAFQVRGLRQVVHAQAQPEESRQSDPQKAPALQMQHLQAEVYGWKQPHITQRTSSSEAEVEAMRKV